MDFQLFGTSELVPQSASPKRFCLVSLAGVLSCAALQIAPRFVMDLSSEGGILGSNIGIG
jgi:hypothetical protein